MFSRSVCSLPSADVPRNRLTWEVLCSACAMLSLSTCLSGCASWAKILQGPSAQSLVSAVPLNVLTDKTSSDYTKFQDNSFSDDDDKQNFLARVVVDSESKCLAFLNGVIIAENSVNTTGDVVSTALTAAATVLKPITAVHGLTAGATLATGTKTAVNANIYAKASIANFQTALEKSYFKSISDYLTALPNLKGSGFLVTAEVAKLESIHATCTLAAAESSIASTIASPTNAPAKPTGLAAKAFDSAVQLTWSSVADATSYNVYRGTSANGEAKTPTKPAVTGTSFVDTSLVDGTQYFYKISAVNGAGESAQSDEVSASPAAGLGTPPAAVPTPTKGAIPGANLNTGR
jgi:hypothetical protein